MRLFEAKDPFEVLTEDEQERITIGNKAQTAVARDFEWKFPGSKCVYMAGKSSKRTDIIMKLSTGQEVHIECKAMSELVTLYDSTIHRGSVDPILDWFASRATNGNENLTMAQVVDFYREKEKRYGFAGDEGSSAKTGLVPALWIRSPSVCGKLRQILMARYIERNENYFALVTSSGITYHYLSGIKIPELGLHPFPKIVRAKTDTYGGAGASTIRVAIKAVISW